MCIRSGRRQRERRRLFRPRRGNGGDHDQPRTAIPDTHRHVPQCQAEITSAHSTATRTTAAPGITAATHETTRRTSASLTSERTDRAVVISPQRVTRGHLLLPPGCQGSRLSRAGVYCHFQMHVHLEVSDDSVKGSSRSRQPPGTAIGVMGVRSRQATSTTAQPPTGRPVSTGHQQLQRQGGRPCTRSYYPAS